METSAKILAAADAVLAEEGYEGASIGRVAERAGVNKALVFYHYDSKTKLVRTVLEQYYRAHQDTLVKAFGEEGDVRERLHAVIDAYFTFMTEHRRYPRLVQGMIASGGEAQAMVQDSQTALYKFTVKMLAGITPKKGPLAARQFYSTFSSMVTTYFTYAPVLGEAWGEDPLGPRALEDRRAHVHWMVDTVLDRLMAPGRSARTREPAASTKLTEGTRRTASLEAPGRSGRGARTREPAASTKLSEGTRRTASLEAPGRSGRGTRTREPAASTKLTEGTRKRSAQRAPRA